ncbi:MAG TPA: hypothetical protein VK541_12410, partial [Pedobacter sp.]|uniref:hypothetical protein n=1 Tax=Pedobacter sp. TaxID=1411316 RepID=UPI002CAB3A24
MKPVRWGFMLAFTLLSAIALKTTGVVGQEKEKIVKSQYSVEQKQPIVLNPSDLNFLKAPLAEYTNSLKESNPRGFWVQGWNSLDQSFRWTVTAPKAGSYVFDVLISGEPGTTIEIISSLNRLTLILPPGNDLGGNNWNRLRVPGTLSLPEGVSSIEVRSPAPKG